MQSEDQSNWNVRFFEKGGSQHIDSRIGVTHSESSEIYKINPLANFTAKDSKNDTNSPFKAITSSLYTIFLAGTEVYVLDQLCSKIIKTITLDCIPEVISVNQNSDFLIVGDCNATIHFIHLKLEMVVLSHHISPVQSREEETKKTPTITFLQTIKGSSAFEELFVFVDNNTLYRFSNINFTALNEVLDTNDMEGALKIKSNIHMEIISLDLLYNYKDSFLVYPFEENMTIQLILGGKGFLSIWSQVISETINSSTVIDDYVKMTTLNQGISKIRMSKSNSYILTLTNNGRLLIWSRSLVLLYCFDKEEILDFEILSDESQNGSYDHFVFAAVTKYLGENKLQVFRYPSYSVLYSITIDSSFRLFCQAKNSMTRIYFAEEIGKNCWNIQTLEVVQPLLRIKELVAGKLYSEAEDLARIYNINPKEIAQEKISNYLKSSETTPLTLLSKEIIHNLDFVESLDFCFEFCSKVVLKIEDEIYNLLSYLKRRAESTNSDRFLINEIFLLQQKFGTYQLIKGIVNDEAPGNLTSVRISWKQFRWWTFMDIMKLLLGTGNINAAIIVWRRHQFEAPEKYIAEMLEYTSEEAQCSQILKWLNFDILPLVVEEKERVKVVEWLNCRARLFELNDHNPTQALSILKLLNILRKNKDGELKPLREPIMTNSVTPGQYLSTTLKSPFILEQECPEFSQGFELLESLQDIAYLKTCHNFEISLKDYEKTAKSSIALALLDRIASAELLKNEIEHHFCPYTSKHNLSKDEILLEYCLELMDGATTSADAPWEERVLVLLGAIESIESKVEIIMEIMRRTPIPWTKDVDLVINEILNYPSLSHFDEISEQYRLMHLKLMLANYGVKNFNMSDMFLAKGLLNFILSKVDIASSMEDALKLVDAFHHLTEFDAFLSRLQYMFYSTKLKEAEQLMVFICNYQPKEDYNNLYMEVAAAFLSWLQEKLEILNCMEGTDNDSYSNVLQFSFAFSQLMQNFIHLKSNNSIITLNILSSAFNKNIHCAIRLYKEFGLRILPAELSSDDRCIEIVSKWLDQNGGSSSENMGESDYIRTTKVYRIAEILGVKRNKLKSLIALDNAKKGHFRAAFNAAKELSANMGNDEKSNFYLTLTTEIVKSITGSTSLATNMFRWSENVLHLAQEAMCVCQIGVVPEFLDKFKAYEMSFFMAKHCTDGEYQTSLNIVDEPLDDFGNDLFNEHVFETGLVLSVNSVMKMLCIFIVDLFENQKKVQPTGKNKKTGNLEEFIFHGKQLMDSLIEHRSYPMCLRTFLVLVEQIGKKLIFEGLHGGYSIERTDLTSIVDIEFYNHLLENCIHKVLTGRHIDQILGLGYALSLPMERGFIAYKSGMTTVGADYDRLIKLANMGMGCAIGWKQRGFYLDCKSIANNAHWWSQLKLLGIPFDDNPFKNSSDGSYQRNLIPDLIIKTSFDLTTVIEFSRAYNIEDDFPLLEYVKHSLISTTVKDYQSNIIGVIDDITNKSKLLNMLVTKVHPILSPYDYEKIQFTFNIMQKIDPENEFAKKGLMVISVLNGYSRKNAPNNSEIEILSRNASKESDIKDENSKKLPDVVYTRLPFHHIMEEPWNILSNELSENTIPTLLPLSLPLDLSPDKFYVTIIGSMVKKMIENDKENKMPLYKFAEFKKLILEIKDLELAVLSAKHVADSFIPGSGKIQAFRTAVNVAEKWMHKICQSEIQGTKEKVALALKRLKESLAKCETEDQLTTLGLMEFMSYVNRPTELICELYNRKGIESLSIKMDYDFHAIINEIAKRHGIDADKTRHMLLTKWLTAIPEITEKQREELLPSTRMQINNTFCPKSEVELQQKLLFLLNYGDRTKNITFLLGSAYQQRSSHQVSTITRIRALSVIFSMSPADEIDKIHSYNEVRSYLQLLLYLSDFEELRIPQTLKEFDGCCKKALAQSLWVKYHDEPKAIQLVCNLCLDYHIYDCDLWENALHRLIHFSMYNYLIEMVEHIVTIPELAGANQISLVIHKVFTGAFEYANSLSDDARAFLYKRTLSIVPKCPCILEIPMNQMINHIINMKSTDVILSYLSLLPRTELLDEAIKNVVSSLPQGNLIHTLEGFLNEISSINEQTLSRDVIVNALFQMINETEQFSEMLESKHLKEFVLYLCRSDKMEKLISKSLIYHMENKALELVHLYYHIHPDKVSLDQPSRSQLLKLYCHHHNIPYSSL